jgi:hypothetical protein
MPTIDELRAANPALKDVDDKTIFDQVSRITGLDADNTAVYLGIPKSRNIAAVANDLAIEFANAAVGGVKSIADFVEPGTDFSKGLGEFIESGERKQSLASQISKEKLGRALESDEIGTQLKGVGSYVTESPLLTAAQALGSFVVPGSAIKGARGAAGALGMAEKGIARTATGAGMATGGAMAGGDAAGEAYDAIMNSPRFADLAEAERQELATRAARKASLMAAPVGFAMGAFGAEAALAKGATTSILKTGAKEFGSEFIEEGATKLSANVAANEYDPDVSIAKGVLGSAAFGGIMGGGTGLTVGALTKQRSGSVLADANDIGTETNTESGAINKAIDSQAPAATINLPQTTQQVTPTEQAQQAAAQASAQQQKDQETLAQQQAELAELNKVRQATYAKYGGETVPLSPTKNVYKFQGKVYFTENQLNQAVDKFVATEKEKSPVQLAVEDAYLQANALTGGKALNPNSLAKAVSQYVEQAESIEEVLARVQLDLDNALKAVKSQQQLAKVEPIHALRDELAGIPAEQRVPTIDLLPKGQLDGKLQLQKQSDAGVRAVSEQGGTTEGDGRGPGVLQPSSVQSEQPGSVAKGQTSKQAGQPAAGGVRAGTTIGTAGRPSVQSRQDEKQRTRQEITFEQDDLLVGTAEKRGKAVARLINGIINKGIAAGKRYSDIKKSLIKTANTNLSGAGFRKLDAFLKANTKKDTEKGKTARLSDEQRVELADEILAKRFAKSKNKERDIEIAKAYLKDMTDKNVQALAKKYKIQPVTVRKIGNFETIMEAADSMDINRDDTERLFGVREAEGYTDTTESAEEIEKEVTALEEGATEDTTPVLSDEEAFGDADKGKKAGFATLKEGSQGTANVFDFEKASYKDRVEKLKEGKLDKDALGALYEQALDKEDTQVMQDITDRLTALAQETAKKVKRRNVKKEMEAEAAAEEGGTEGKTAVEKAEALWNKYAEQHGLGLYEDQTPVVQGYVVDLVYDKKDNLAGLNQLITDNDLIAATEKTQFSRSEGAGKNSTYDATDLKSLLKQMFSANKRFDELVTIVDSYEELPKYVKAVVKKAGDIQAFVYGRRVYMIASQIQVGQELPVFLHEVGVHLGMENLLGTDNYRKLTAQVLDWSKSKKDSLESIIARNAQGRVDAAVEVAKAEGKPLTTNEQLDELLAYFVEEAVALGIQPQAIAKQEGPIAAWFRTLMAAMKVALRKIGFGKFDQLSANNLVDLAFGAAKLEISGTYHGTSAEFRNFKTSAIGTGEGAVAYGWGLYVAQRFGIALDYMRADVKRKFSDVFGVFADRKVTYKGKDYTELTSFDLDLYRKDFAQFMENSIAQSVLNRLQHNNVTVKEAIDSSKRANTRLLAETEEKLNKKGIFTKKLPDAVRKDLERSVKFYKDSLAAIDRIKEEDFAVVDAAKKPGQVLRNLPMTTEDKILDLDVSLSKQPEILKILEAKLSEELKTNMVEEINMDLDEMTGRDLQDALVFLENKGISDLFFQLPDSVIDTIKQGRFMSKQVVSEYLRMLGIEGNTYLDRSSRGLAGTVAVNKIPLLKDVDFSGIKGFKPSYVAIKGSRLNIVSSDKQSIPLDMLIPSGSDEYMAILENVLDERDRETKNMVLFSDNALSRVVSYEGGLSSGNVRFSRRQQGNIQKLPKQLQGPVAEITATIRDLGRRGLTYLAFTEDLARIASKYVKSATDYVKLVREQQAVKTKYERRVDLILQQYDKLDAKVRGTGPGTVNAFLKKSTVDGKWAYDPGYLKKAPDIDPVLKAEFDALPKDAQDVVKAVFKHGHDTLQDMKRGVIENINSEYDALIKAARDANDMIEVASLEQKKAASLKDYSTLMAVRAGKPYAPLKRFGNYVVVAKSNAYLQAEKDAKDKSKTVEQRKEAQAKIRELEKNETDYYVAFAETKREGRKIEEQLLTEGYGYVSEAFEKDSAKQDVYGGRDVQNVFYRLRNLANDSMDEAGSAKATQAINRLIADLHLTLLAEQSARQSERRRKNVAGAEDDMMRSFATQGLATAHFISTLHNSGKIYDTLQQMRKEADEQKPGRDVRREYYNEFMRRHALGLSYEPSPVINKALGATSFWMLLTNPAYYLQNMTQPFMMSLPYVAGKHDYNQAWGEFTTAYKQIFNMIKNEGLSEESYSKLPADVREAIETLVNNGRIDISLDQDLGRWRDTEGSKAELAGKAIEKLRKVAQDIESINRVATAVAAYRLEIKAGSNKEQAVAYADDVILRTHGDYSGFNAPRITRQGLGRLATQFRKFQLIQISLMAKLIKDSFAGASKQEKMIARRALGFTLGHTLAVGGLMGFPGFAAIAWIMGAAFGDDDEPDNPELTLRKMIGDKALADIILKGAPKFAGVDLSGKLGMGQMLSILPYADVDLSRAGIAQGGYALLTGATGSLIQRAGEGVALMADGEYYKGLERLSPAGLAQSMKAARFGLMDGVTLKNGDVVIKPEDISFLDMLSVAIGLPSNKITDRTFVQGAAIDTEQFYKDRTGEIKRDYVKASNARDTDGMAKARKEWQEMQDAKRRNGLKVQPLSDLLKAPQEQKKREAGVVGGVQTTKSNREFMRQISKI